MATYRFVPKQDITTHELAEVVAIGFVRVDESKYDQVVPVHLRRHFRDENILRDEVQRLARYA